ncbi:MAG: PEP-utilizing enzyme [Actinomycetota bacterium]
MSAQNPDGPTGRQASETAWPADNAPSARWPIYTRGNVGEVYPDVVLPLEWELGGLASERGWRRGAETVGFLTPDDYGPGDLVLIGVFGGYAYFNASLMRLLGVRTPGLAVDVIDQQFLGEAAAGLAPYEASPGDRNLRATTRVLATAIRTLRARSVPLIDEMRTRVETYRRHAPPLDAERHQLWGYVNQGLDELWEYLIASHVIVTMQATIAAGRLTDLCENRLGDPNLAVALTTGIGDVVSAEPARELWQLANDTPADEFDAAFARFLDRHGHRGPNEFSLVGRDWAGNPELALAAIETMRGADPERSPQAMADRMVDERERAVAEARRRLGWRGRGLDGAIEATARWSRAREASKNEVIRASQVARHRLVELQRRATDAGGVEDRLGPLLLSIAEFEAYLDDPPSMVTTIEERTAAHRRLVTLEPPFAFDSTEHGGAHPPTSTWAAKRTEAERASSGEVLAGAAGAPGVTRGLVRVITDPADPRGLQPGEILVAPLTDPSWTPLFVPAGGVVVEVGAAMSHSMIVSRELGIPCVVGVADATLRLADGMEVELDGQAGTVRVVS